MLPAADEFLSDRSKGQKLMNYLSAIEHESRALKRELMKSNRFKASTGQNAQNSGNTGTLSPYLRLLVE